MTATWGASWANSWLQTWGVGAAEPANDAEQPTGGWEAYVQRVRAQRARDEARRLAEEAPSKRKRRAKRVYRIALDAPQSAEIAEEAVKPYQSGPTIDWDALIQSQQALFTLLLAFEAARNDDDLIVALLMAA